MYFNNGEMLIIKNIENISDIILYTQKGEETNFALNVGDTVKLVYNAKNKVTNYFTKYCLIRDNLNSQDFSEKDIYLLFSDKYYLKKNLNIKLYQNEVILPKGTEIFIYENIDLNKTKVTGIINSGSCKGEDIFFNISDLTKDAIIQEKILTDDEKYNQFYNSTFKQMKEYYTEIYKLRKEFDELLRYDKKVNSYDLERYIDIKKEINELKIKFDITVNLLIEFVNLYSTNKDLKYEFGTDISDYGKINKCKEKIKEYLI